MREDYCEGVDIIIVQGDALDLTFKLEGIPCEEIASVTFNSKGGGIEALCTLDCETFECRLELSSLQTKNLAPYIGTYDLTATLKDGNQITLLYECGFAVVRKRNCANV